MRAARIKVRVDSKIKKSAEAFAKKLGVDLDVVLNACLHRLIQTRNILSTPTDRRAILKEIKLAQ